MRTGTHFDSTSSKITAFAGSGFGAKSSKSQPPTADPCGGVGGGERAGEGPKLTAAVLEEHAKLMDKEKDKEAGPSSRVDTRHDV